MKVVLDRGCLGVNGVFWVIFIKRLCEIFDLFCYKCIEYLYLKLKYTHEWKY